MCIDNTSTTFFLFTEPGGDLVIKELKLFYGKDDNTYDNNNIRKKCRKISRNS